jgi:glutathione S-transferase
MLTLYFAPGTSSFAAHIALHEVGAEFESRPLSFDNKDQRKPEYLAINPEGKVPTLVIDGRPLTEVAGILFYLARAYPKARLLPEGAEDEARAVSWMSFIASTLHPARKSGAEQTLKVYGIADARLKGRDWALGAYSIVDIHLFRLYWRLRTALDLPDGALPNLAAHHERMMERDAVRKVAKIEEALGYELPSWFPSETRTKDYPSPGSAGTKR